MASRKVEERDRASPWYLGVAGEPVRAGRAPPTIGGRIIWAILSAVVRSQSHGNHPSLCPGPGPVGTLAYWLLAVHESQAF